MTAEEHIKKLHEKSKPTKEEIKRARRIAIVLAASTVVSILFLVFAFVQKTEADKLQELTLELRVELLEVKEQAEQAQQEAEMQRAFAFKAQLDAQQALEECNKNKK